MKKLLLLGGSRYLLPVIKEAHALGCHVITCDYLPDNIAHKYSDEYRNVSITDQDAVLRLARERCVDGIMSFATDPGVTTAAFVCEQLGLPTCPYKSVEILQNKAKFRAFLSENSFNVPFAKGYSDIADAVREADLFRWPVIVKPVDSAGSKGVKRVDSISELKEDIKNALKFSRCNAFIIEEFIEKSGFSSDSDCFSVDGALVFASFSNQRFDECAENPYAPSAYSWPSSIAPVNQEILRSELQRLITLLDMGTSIYNVEARVGADGKPYLMEVAPRGGGNRLAEMLQYATGVNLIKNAVKAALGETDLDVSQQPYKGSWAEYILHSNESGIYNGLEIEDSLKRYIREEDIWVSVGDTIRPFSGANEAIGTLAFEFDNQEQLSEYLLNMKDLVRVKVFK